MPWERKSGHITVGATVDASADLPQTITRWNLEGTQREGAVFLCLCLVEQGRVHFPILPLPAYLSSVWWGQQNHTLPCDWVS